MTDKKAYSKAYYEKNKPRICEYQRQYYRRKTDKKNKKPSSRFREIGIAILKFICNPLKYISWRR